MVHMQGIHFRAEVISALQVIFQIIFMITATRLILTDPYEKVTFISREKLHILLLKLGD